MGIDAEMLIRNVPARIVTDEWLKEMSWRLCTALGAEHFYIRDGLPHTEYASAYAAWESGFKGHALYREYKEAARKWKEDATAREEAHRLHAAILADLGPEPRERRLAIDRTLACYREEGDPDPGSEYHEDSYEPIKARPGECLLQLSLWGRYYGEGYERGDILTYCAIAEWLEVNIPGCEVWYGGDSSGVLAERFDEDRRRQLRRHLYSTEGRAYFTLFGLFAQRDPLADDQPLPPPCGLCPKRGYLGSQCGWGEQGQFAAFHCSGCGKSVETHDGGKTWAAQQRPDTTAAAAPIKDEVKG